MSVVECIIGVQQTLSLIIFGSFKNLQLGVLDLILTTKIKVLGEWGLVYDYHVELMATITLNC